MMKKYKFMEDAIKRLNSFHKKDREAEFKELLENSAVDVLEDVFKFLKKMRDNVGEEKFRSLLKSLDADIDTIRKTSDIVRHIDDNGRFIFPFNRVLSIIGDNTKRKRAFQRCVYNLTPRRKSEGGGLKEFSDEIRQERNQLSAILKGYFHLYRRRNRVIKWKSKQKEYEQKQDYYKKIIPPSILSEIQKEESSQLIRSKPKYKEIATKWMTKYYPCTGIWLARIIIRKDSKAKKSE